MFKYKSPLSRLLEGAGKAKEDEAVETQVEQEEKPEPIADFNALRAALAGGNMTSEAFEEEAYEETDEVISEETMPEFVENEGENAVEMEQPEPVATADDEDQIVTLHVDEDEAPEEDEASINVFVEPDPIEDAAEKTEAVEDIQAVAEPETAMLTEEETVAEQVEDQTPEQVVDDVTPEPTPVPTSDRRGRVKTTFLGFERGDTHVQDLMETAEPVASSAATEQTYPVGWLVVTAGPGRGASITLTEGLMQIGRNDDQAIQLDFGDTGISRSNHAVIAYDPEDRKCYLGHGGKANLVRLNGKPVLSTVALSSGDLIRISDTSIRFAAFCDDGFDWRDAD